MHALTAARSTEDEKIRTLQLLSANTTDIIRSCGRSPEAFWNWNLNRSFAKRSTHEWFSDDEFGNVRSRFPLRCKPFRQPVRFSPASRFIDDLLHGCLIIEGLRSRFIDGIRRTTLAFAQYNMNNILLNDFDDVFSICQISSSSATASHLLGIL